MAEKLLVKNKIALRLPNGKLLILNGAAPEVQQLLTSAGETLKDSDGNYLKCKAN